MRVRRAGGFASWSGARCVTRSSLRRICFIRYAADHPVVLSDPRLVDSRGRGEHALDSWGEVRTPEAMAAMAAQFRDRWGFRVFKLKGGVLDPEVELQTMQELAARLGPKALLRIDPNGRWRRSTAVRIGKKLAEMPLEYYEDPVNGQKAMAEVRRQTGLKMSTNMCVTRFEHIPEALALKPIDVLLCDHHYFGGFAGCQALGPICRAAGWSLSQHSNNHTGVTMAAMIHLAASIPELDAGQRHALPLACREHGHHRGPEACDQGRPDGGSDWAGTGRHARSGQAGAVPRNLYQVWNAGAGRRDADETNRAGLDRRASVTNNRCVWAKRSLAFFVFDRGGEPGSTGCLTRLVACRGWSAGLVKSRPKL